ncbi:hypothetical protein KDAU_46490 [Dictyobacter aurantiacus]|uniref:Uncharacterized protein n=1 Tax=Dictyobacter aurantiacus TaxID=1936993 RepID=A0A401ZKH1_9CHLR|nr:hypothetical protein KDAU_46490 [Dictyobacter aurantiacus]
MSRAGPIPHKKHDKRVRIQNGIQISNGSSINNAARVIKPTHTGLSR